MHPNKANFVAGVRLIFGDWCALRLAVSQEWGGSESAEKSAWLQDEIILHFERDGKKTGPEDIEEILVQVMSTEFNTILEDDSAYHVSQMLCRLYEECVKGETATLETLKLRKAARETRREEGLDRCKALAVDSSDEGDAALEEDEGEDEDGDDHYMHLDEDEKSFIKIS